MQLTHPFSDVEFSTIIAQTKKDVETQLFIEAKAEAVLL